MTSADLATLPNWAFAFALVLCRCSGAMLLLPGLGEAEIPATVRAGLVLTLVALILPSVGMVAPPEGWRTAAMVAAELLCGGVLGWLARCVTLALPMAGQIMSYMLGLTSIISPDPALGQSSAMMRLFSLAVPVLVFGTGLWALPVEAIAGSYTLVPPGALLSIPDSVQAGVGAVASAFGLALRLAAPLILANIIWHSALGVIARLIPQLQVYFAAMPGQIIAGLLLLSLLATGMTEVWLETAQDSFAILPGLQ